MKAVLSVVTAALILAGCTNDAGRERRAGEVRRELFVECMELAAKMPRLSDDDVADIVGECGSQSYYMSYAITQKGVAP